MTATVAKKWSKYAKCRPSRIEWLGEIPEHWDTFPVKRKYEIQLGKMLQNSPESEGDVAVPYIKALHVQWGSVNTFDLPDMWAGPAEIRQFGVRSGDLLVCEGGEAGRAGIVHSAPVPCIIQNALHRVRDKGADVCFLRYVLQSVGSQGWFDVLCNRATIAHLTREKLAELRVPFPPALGEQRTIAAFLDRETARFDALIAKKQRQIELLQEKRAALISHAVTKGLNPNVKMKDFGIEWLGEIPAHWPIAPLYARYIVQLGKMLDEKRITGEYLLPYLRNIDVQWGLVNTENLPEMDFHPDERGRYTLKDGDLLVCEGGEVGRTAIWRGEIAVCGFQKAVHRLRPRSDQDLQRYFHYVMRAATWSGIFVANGNANTIPHLTGEQLRACRFPFPPVEEQRAIAAFLDCHTRRADALIEKIQKSIDLLREYRTALISAAVTGKIDVREEAA